MGSMVSLGIGKLELDWGKNNFYRDHGSLFQLSDVGDIPYYYADNVIEHKEGLSRSLELVKRRLDLLGYGLSSLKKHYEMHLSEVPDYYPDVPLSYDEFYAVVSNLDVSKITLDEEWGDYDSGEFLTKYLFKHPEFNKIINLSEIVDKDIGLVFENIDPYITLRILAENSTNSDLNVYWGYADIVDNGWVTKDEILSNVGAGQEILIVTEGSSDTHILRKAFSLLYSDISDFFTFVDMEENYPFTGDGNLFNFCKGLSSIRIKNNVLVVFDNDVAGVAKFDKLKEIDLPDNMHVIKLPDHLSFENFRTIGPHGESHEDINGTAVAIECFLDHTYTESDLPCVRWTSYNKTLDAYHGELIKKDKYTRKFLKLNDTSGYYDSEKLKYLLDHLYGEWVGRNV
jgi:hypothetical protein